MNMKSVELQVAIPRTQEVSSIHQQMQQRPTLEQSMLNEQAAKLTESLRQRNEKVDASSEGRIRDDEEHASHHDSSTPDKQPDDPEKKNAAVPAEHPYKGKHIDFSV
ncbi:hypothetical protein [Paenibacillus taiwanensis]|uniref:hypothetical protein n=1 Tax=Paenibacillus taiwanensis TaxID=401638 RepID=UPI00041C1079|nr:hypothetical protein [Paenibacillus taiwanensis]